MRFPKTVLHLLPLALLAAPAIAQNQAITLNNNVDGYVEVPYSSQVVPQAGITLEAWITYDDTTLPTGWRYPTIFRQNLNANTEDYFLRIEAGNNNSKVLRFKIVTQVASYTLDWAFTSGQLLTWTHVAGSYDGTTMRLCVNGAQVLSRTASGAIKDQGGPLRIGKGSDVATPIEVWNGSIDEARLWPYGRTPAEILGSYKTELSSLPGFVSSWNFNGNYLDSSTGGLNATMTGSVTFTTNTPTLTTRIFLGGSVGASSPGCLGPIHFAVNGAPMSGNQGFGVAAQRTASLQPAALILGTGALGTPLKILGIDIWTDLVGAVSIPTTSTSLGAVSIGLPIPAGVVGGFASQYVILDPCVPLGLTASNCLKFVILP